MNYEVKMTQFLETVARQGATDLHISPGKPPILRIDGHLVPMAQQDILSPEETQGLIFSLLNEEQKTDIGEIGEIDFSCTLPNKARFRVNAYLQSGFFSSAFRLIPATIRTIEDLNLPAILHSFTKYAQGFFLVVGPSGHGKSTTLAALVDEINHTRNEHVITIEDPIEYQFIPDRCIIDQREVGRDTKTFQSALRAAFRQDPDVIMLGEMRDPETISTAITAAETGHLVMATLHTNNAAQTIDRIIDGFPAFQQAQVRSQLALTLLGVVSQRLIPRVSGGLVPAAEIMVANAAVRNLIRENKIHELNLV